jgi:predicted O-linked N-acetylglucosamine transferase (SPINDLY family)
MDLESAPAGKTVGNPHPLEASPARSAAAAQVSRRRRSEPACWRRGLAAAQARDWAAAARAFEEASRLMPHDAECWLLLANARRKCGNLDRAVEAATRALRIDPQLRLAWELKRACLKAARRVQELQRFLLDTPQAGLDREAWADLIEASLRLGRPKDAARASLQALSKCPHDAQLNHWLGIAFAELGLKAQAIDCLKTALCLDLGPMEAGVRDLLAYYERQVCNWTAAEEQIRGLTHAIDSMPPDAAVCLSPFTHVTLLDDPALQLRAARAHARHLQSGVAALPPRQPARGGRIRIGYVSADFHRHATSYLMAEMLERHDRARFEIVLYSLGRDDGSELRSRLQACGAVFVDALEMEVGDLAQRIRDDGIDILVDLKGYTRDSRPALFALRPAPVQVSYLGYPGSCGASYIDYIVGDPVVTPLEAAEHYAEKIAQMPGCYQCNDGQRAQPLPAHRSDHGLPEEALVLCGFNESYKISPEVFDVWCSLLRELPDAVLWLLECNPEATAALRREAGSRGIAADRLVFAPKIQSAAHLSRLSCADLFLDTWPCNGHTTASDMLWSGVPVVTSLGRTFASRVASSLLHAVGLPKLVCADEPAYQSLVIELAHDRSRLAGMRLHLQEARHSCDLFNGAAAARDLEALFERMWERALAGLPPVHLPAGRQS